MAPSYTATTARFKVSLINPTDSITYNIKIKNLGNLEARIKKITVDVGESDAIEYEVKCKIDTGEYQICNETNFKNQVLQPNKEQMVKIKVSFKEGYIGQPSQANSTSNIRMTIDYVQNFESNGTQILPPEDRAYTIGEKVTFAGSDWYVIEDSPSSQDYLVLLRSSMLNGDELISNYMRSEVYMSYYWSDTCHWENSYGYTDTITSGCPGHNDYAGSKVKEVVDRYMVNYLDQLKLKEVNGYKIRLFTLEELNTIIDLVDGDTSILTWIWGNANYWMMTPNGTVNAYFVNWRGTFGCLHIARYSYGVRPVINLLKSAIE